MIMYKKLATNEIEIVRQLAHDIWNTSYKTMLSKEQIDYMLNWMYSAETIKKELDSGVYWELIELDGKNIGYISMTDEGEKLKLNKLYILPNIQGKGIGSESLQHVIHFARGKNYKQIYLTVNQNNNKAINAYKKAGFECIEFKIFDIGGGFVMDDYIYSYNL